jgi:hypothetical protein
LTNSEVSEGTQVRKTVSFSKKRDKDLIKLKDLQEDFSYNAKQLMRDGLRFRQLMQAQQINLNNPTMIAPMMENMVENAQIREDFIEEIEPKKVEKIEEKAVNLDDFLNSKTKKAEISEEDRKRIEENLDF